MQSQNIELIWLSIVIGVVSVTGCIIFFRTKIKRLHQYYKIIGRDAMNFKSLIDAIPDTIYFKDRQSRFLLINKAQVHVLGEEREEDAYGKTDFDYFKHAQQAYDEEQQIMNTETPVMNHIIEIENVPGDKMHLMETKFPMYDDNRNCIGLVGISRDITQLIILQNELVKAKEKAEQADKLKSAFLANISHEVRTPLNAIVGFSNLICDEDITNQERELFMRYISSNTELLLKLINDLLDHSKIEAGVVDIYPKQFGLNGLFENVIATQKFGLKSSVTLKFSPREPDLQVFTDKTKLMQVLNNLVYNAKKFTTKGFIEIGYSKTNENTIECFVKDTGIGIPADKQNDIFDTFTKLNVFSQGTGLGLAICKSLVKLLGGEIHVESKMGKGSRFVFTIEQRITKSESKYPQAEDAAETIQLPKIERRVRIDNIRILVAEDNDSNFQLLYNILKKQYQIERARNGLEAVEFALKKQTDLVLMDLKMPEMDGIEAIQAIRKEKLQLPIIAQSAHTYESDRNRALRAGCDEFITKPIDINQLNKLLNKYLK
jgi:PAS domain S-box-containing protein